MRTAAIVVINLLFASTLFADSLRSDKHLLKIEGSSHQYKIDVFDGETRQPITTLHVFAKGDAPAEAETIANGTRYNVLVVPHGEAFLIEFTASNGAEVIDAARGGFTAGKKPNAPPKKKLRAGRDIKESKVIRRVDAVYTDEARAAGATGSVILDVSINSSGFVDDVTVVRGMAYGLSESAVDALKQWQFEPASQIGVPVEVIHEVTVDFRP